MSVDVIIKTVADRLHAHVRRRCDEQADALLMDVWQFVQSTRPANDAERLALDQARAALSELTGALRVLGESAAYHSTVDAMLAASAGLEPAPKRGRKRASVDETA